MRVRGSLFALQMILLAPAAGATEDGWRLEKNQDGIRVETRAVEGWEFREMRGVTHFDGPLSSLLAVLDDPDAVPRLNRYVESSTVIRRDGARSYELLSITNMPWPLKDRYVLTRRAIDAEPATGVVTVTDDATDGPVPDQADRVRITRSHTRMTLTPRRDGGVDIELRMLADPNGSIPASMVNSMAISTPFEMLANLRRLADEPAYAAAEPAVLAALMGA